MQPFIRTVYDCIKRWITLQSLRFCCSQLSAFVCNMHFDAKDSCWDLVRQATSDAPLKGTNQTRQEQALDVTWCCLFIDFGWTCAQCPPQIMFHDVSVQGGGWLLYFLMGSPEIFCVVGGDISSPKMKTSRSSRISASVKDLVTFAGVRQTLWLHDDFLAWRKWYVTVGCRVWKCCCAEKIHAAGPCTFTLF